MSSSIVITIVVLAAIAWVSYLAVSALRSRGSEEVAANLAPGTTDDEMETKRLEGIQLSAVVLSGILAVSIPVYYLTETNRQEGFVEEFSETAIEHGHEWYIEFQCGDCHGADGGGGAASYVEKRTGVTVTWEAPSINDVYYRYDREEVKYWLIYGRGNSPMPAWGLEGGGPMNDAQLEELLDYMQSEEFQIEQEAVLAEVEPEIAGELARLEGADAAIAGALLDQQQLIADLLRANDIEDDLTRTADEAADVLDGAGEGIDTDGDGLSDTAEAEIVALNLQAREVLLIDPLSLNLTFQPDDPDTNGIPDLDAAEDLLRVLRTLADNPLEDDVQSAPVLGPIADSIEAILAGIADDDGTDDDGDGLTNTQEQQLAGQASNVVSTLVDGSLPSVNLDPTMEETAIGVPDLQTAREAVAALNTVALNARVTEENIVRILPPARVSLDNLVDAAINQRWEFDFEGIAANNDISVEEAERVVGIYNGYCARCHTSGYSAGLAFTQVAGSGGIGPALWDGRPAVQFLSDEDLTDFLIVGAVPNQPYGVNGFGNGRMPAFGAILSESDISLLAQWLRNGDLTGRGTLGDDLLEAGAMP
ncbi:MAG: cytochrome c [Acidimicrobiia bacterium]|nr:cytochrome c [Acidimicrobiia bacterium]